MSESHMNSPIASAPEATGTTKETTPNPLPQYHAHNPTTTGPPSPFRVLLGVLLFLATATVGFNHLSTGQDIRLSELWSRFLQPSCDCGGAAPNPNPYYMDDSNTYDDGQVPVSCIPQDELDQFGLDMERLSTALEVEQDRVRMLEAELQGYRLDYYESGEGDYVHGEGRAGRDDL